MKLVDLVNRIDTMEDDIIIFQENVRNFDSDIILTGDEQELAGDESGTKHHYLIEVFLAKEFITEWKQSLDYNPTLVQIAKRLHDYAINDA